MAHLALLIWGFFWPGVQDDVPAAADVPAEAEETDTGFRIGVAVDQVFLSVNARSAQGGFLRGLTRDQFTVYEDGVRQEILNFYSEALPVRVVLLVDVSGSTRGSQSEIRRAALRFVDSLGEEDQIAVITFSNLPKLILDWTNDRERIQNAMLKIYAKGKTVLNDALYVTCDDLLAGVSGRKAIILLSDGIDTHSMVTSQEVLDLVTRSEAMTYVASTVEAYWVSARHMRIQLQSRGRLVPRQMTDEYIVGVKKFLRTLADRTGGRV
ncbi:MAG: VWA domain-containing protein, partial [Candidatus Aminicenantes bacterium]|nr:VWA domain-containing protein [Candidatus Aminicenantes bacterium]